MENQTECSKKQIKSLLAPIRLLSLNQDIPFCFVINQSTISYIAGSSIVVENIRTLQQEIVWSGENYYHIISVAHNPVSYGPIRFALLLKNLQSRVLEIAVFYLDWNNYFYQKQNQFYIKLQQLVTLLPKQKNNLYQQNQSNFTLQFDAKGDNLAMHTIEQGQHFLTIFNLLSKNHQFRRQNLQNALVLMKSFTHQSQPYIALLYERSIQIVPMFVPTGKKQGLNYFKNIVWSELFNKLQENEPQQMTKSVKLRQKQQKQVKQLIIQLQFGKNHQGDIIGFALTNVGNFFLYKLTTIGIQNVFKIDVKANKETMKLQCQLKKLQNEQKITNKQFSTIRFLDNPQIFPKSLVDIQGQLHIQNGQNNSQNQKSQHFMNSHLRRSTKNRNTKVSLLINPTYFVNQGNRLMFGYEKSRRLVYITYSLVNYCNYSVVSTQNQIYFSNESIQAFQKDHQKDKIRQQKQVVNIYNEQEIKVQRISLASNLCTAGLVVRNKDYFYINIIDVLNSIVPVHSKLNSSNLVFGNFGFKGICKSVAYSNKQSTLFILYDRNNKSYLSYYNLNYPRLSTTTPSSLLLWQQLLKFESSSISLHPLNHSLLILYSQLPRIHFYTYQNLSQYSISLNIPNVQCGGYTPCGDKIVLCNAAGIYIVDAYRYDIFNVITGPIYKIVRNLKFVNTFQIVVEYAIGSGSYLLHVFNYTRTKSIGQIHTLLNSNEKNIINLNQQYRIQSQQYKLNKQIGLYSAKTLIQIDLKRQFIIYVHVGHQLRFYNFNMDVLNVIMIQPQCVYLCDEIQALFVGTTKGTLYIFKWPDIINKVTNISQASIDQEVIAIRNVHKDKIVSIQLTINLRFIIVISEQGQISILQFLQENSINISRRSALSMLRKNELKPQNQFCLTSSSRQTKRTETIVKTIGKQVQVNKKNQVICEQLVKQLQETIKQQRFKTQVLIKDQIDYSEQEKKIKSLLRRMDNMRLQFTQLSGKYKKIREIQKQNFDQNLLNNFKQKDKLEKQYSNLVKSLQIEYKQEKQKLESQLQQIQVLQSNQLYLLQKDTKTTASMEEKYKKYSQIQLHRLQQTKIQTVEMIILQYKQELQQLYQKRNCLQNNIRKLTISNSQLKNKNNSFTNLRMDLCSDMNLIKKLTESKEKTKLQAQQSLKQTKLLNQQLIYKERSLEIVKKNEQKLAKSVQQRHKDLIDNIEKLQTVYKQVNSRKQQLDDQFFEQNKRKIYLCQKIEEMKENIIQLKNKRNRVKQQATLNIKKCSKSLYFNKGSLCNSVINNNKSNNQSLLISQDYRQKVGQRAASGQMALGKYDVKKINKKKLGKQLNTSQSSQKFHNNLNRSKQSLIKLSRNQFSKTNISSQMIGINHQSKNYAEFMQEAEIQKQNQAKQLKDMQQLKQNIEKRDRANEKLQKLNHIKNDKIRKYKVINQKLINDRKRIITQLNQLKRYNDNLRKKQEKLKQQLQVGSLCTNLKPSGSQNQTNCQRGVHYQLAVAHKQKLSTYNENQKWVEASSKKAKLKLLKKGYASMHINPMNGINQNI